GAAFDTLPAGTPDQLKVEVMWTSTLTARVGFAFDRLLFYGKAGAAFVFHRDTVINAVAGTDLGSAVSATWTVGAGIDWAVTEHWIARLDYEYINMPTKAFLLAPVPQISPPAGEATQLGGRFNEVRVGMAYKF